MRKFIRKITSKSPRRDATPSTPLHPVDKSSSNTTTATTIRVTPKLAGSDVTVQTGLTDDVDGGQDMWQLAEAKLRQDPGKRTVLEKYDELLKRELGADLAAMGSQKRRDQMLLFVSSKVEQLTAKDNRKFLGDFTDKVEEYFEKALHGVIKCKAIISAASQPCLPASVACAGVMLLLSACVQAIDEREIFYSQMTDISWTIFRITEYEHLLWRKDGASPNEEVKLLISDACANILYLEARAAAYLEGNGLKKGLRDAFKVDDWQTMSSSLDLAEAKVKDCAERDNFKVNQNTNRLVRDLHKRRQAQESGAMSRSELFLESLYKHAYRYEDSKNRNSKPVKGTCEWFGTHEKFTVWNESKSTPDGRSALLYVTADPGCGKSVLSRHLVDSVLRRPGRVICYSFFKDDFDDQKSSCKAICAMLHQLLTSSPDRFNEKDPVMKDYVAKGEGYFDSFATLWKSFESVARRQQTICLLDALDECDDTDRSPLLEAIASADVPSLKILVTSRPYDHIRREFADYHDGVFSSIHLQGDRGPTADAIVKEIQLVVEGRIEKLASVLELTQEEHDLLKAELSSIPNRTYLWVTLVFDGLMTSGLTKRDILELSHQLPSGVNEAYEKILARSRDQEKARKTLHIILAAQRPLNLAELSTALAADGQRSWKKMRDIIVPASRMRNYIRDICGLFIVIVHDRVYLLHQTAREFLLADHPPALPQIATTVQVPWQRSMFLQVSHAVLADVCITCVLVSCSEASESMYAYSAEYWHHHYSQSSTAHQDATVKNAKELCLESKLRSEWVRYSPSSQDNFLPTSSPLCIAAALGLLPVISYFFRTDSAAVDYSLNQLGRTPLHWAASQGHCAVVDFLIEHCKNDIDRPDMFEVTPLSAAFTFNHWEAVESLLATDMVDANVLNRQGQTPLSRAAAQGRVGTMTKLLDAKAIVDLRDQSLEKHPLMEAAFHGHEAAVRLLLERGAFADVIAENGWTPLSRAAYFGYEAVVRVLVEYGAEIDFSNRHCQLPLLQAALSGHPSILDLLLDHGADIERKDNFGWTALSTAAAHGSEAVVRLLLGRGAAIDTLDSEGSSPLAEAAHYNCDKVVRCLLTHGAQVDLPDKRGNTALMHAAARGSLKSIRVLVTAGNADVNRENDRGESPIILAARGSHESAIQFLLAHDALVNLKVEDDRAQFADAAKQGHEASTKFLIDKFGDKLNAPKAITLSQLPLTSWDD